MQPVGQARSVLPRRPTGTRAACPQLHKDSWAAGTCRPGLGESVSAELQTAGPGPERALSHNCSQHAVGIILASCSQPCVPVLAVVFGEMN